MDITTSDVEYAGTDNWVYMVVVGTEGMTSEVGLDKADVDDMVYV